MEYFSEGWAGFENGLDQVDNPYTPDTDEFAAWNEGWLGADDESTEANWDGAFEDFADAETAELYFSY